MTHPKLNVSSRSRHVVTTLLLLSGLALGQSADSSPADESVAKKVLALVGQIEKSDELAKREAAEKELIALGPEILPLLPTMTARTPAEVKNRVGRVRNALVKAE